MQRNLQTEFTTSEVAQLLGIRPWQVRRCFEQHELPETASRYRGARLIPGQRLPELVDALRRRRYLPAEQSKPASEPGTVEPDVPAAELSKQAATEVSLT